MNFQQHRWNIIAANRLKAKTTRLASLATQLKEGSLRSKGATQNNWYQERKKAVQKLRALSSNRIQLMENGYRGHHRRHWLKDTRCEHVFRASLKEVHSVGAKAACPFCHVPTDLRRCGTVEALQEHVNNLSHGNVFLLNSNELGDPDELYQFDCLLHQYRFWAPYRYFVRQPEYVCPACAFKTWTLSND